MPNEQILKTKLGAFAALLRGYTSDPMVNKYCDLLDESVAKGDAGTVVPALEELSEWLNANLGSILNNSFTTHPDTYAKFANEVPEIIDQLKRDESLLTQVPQGNPNRKRMVFISHSSKDASYVKESVELLRKVGLTQENLFCSSYAGYGIPTGKDIFDFLKHCFTDYELLVIFIISKDNYYSSPASLNEMGAAWVQGVDCIPILLPGMKPGDMRGAIGSGNLALALDGQESKYRMRELKDKVCDFLGIDSSHDNTWDYDLDNFMQEVAMIESQPSEDEAVESSDMRTSYAMGGNDDLVERLAKGEASLNDALFYLKIAARRSGDEELANWVDKELKGYGPDDELPEYRETTSVQFVYSGFNGGYQVSNVPLQPSFIGTDILEKVKHVEARQGIATIESALKADKGLSIDRSILARVVSEKTNDTVRCVSISQQVPMDFFQSIATAVKEEVIDRLLESEKRAD